MWIGHSILEPPLHHPVAMAKAVTVVRMGAGPGRMIFDVGRWWPQSRHRPVVVAARAKAAADGATQVAMCRSTTGDLRV